MDTDSSDFIAGHLQFVLKQIRKNDFLYWVMRNVPQARIYGSFLRWCSEQYLDEIARDLEARNSNDAQKTKEDEELYPGLKDQSLYPGFDHTTRDIDIYIPKMIAYDIEHVFKLVFSQMGIVEKTCFRYDGEKLDVDDSSNNRYIVWVNRFRYDISHMSDPFNENNYDFTVNFFNVVSPIVSPAMKIADNDYENEFIKKNMNYRMYKVCMPDIRKRIIRPCHMADRSVLTYERVLKLVQAGY
jgi:hypothetical protein